MIRLSQCITKIVVIVTGAILASGCSPSTDEVAKVSEVGKPIGELSAENIRSFTGMVIPDTAKVEMYELDGVKVSGNLDTSDFHQLVKLVEKQCNSREKPYIILGTPDGEKVIATSWNTGRTEGHRFTFDRTEREWKLTKTRVVYSFRGQR